jgi:SAM-dependent methyltransferase
MREITLPPVHNKRSPAQWEIISKHVDFKGKTVLDLGCGYADLLWRVNVAGARQCLGIDNDRTLTVKNRRISIDSFGVEQRVLFLTVDIMSLVEGEYALGLPTPDVILCFSALPYLDDILGTLKWIHNHSCIALIECQLSGDGPGPEWLMSDDNMYELLHLAGWRENPPVNIGTTYIPDRDKHRTVWMCKS